MALGDIMAHVMIGVSLIIMGAAISRAHKLMVIIKKSKAESVWTRNLILLYILGFLYIVIMITRLFNPNTEPITGTNTFHNLTMNTAFLISSYIIFNMVNLEIAAFTSFFELLDIEEDEGIEV